MRKMKPRRGGLVWKVKRVLHNFREEMIYQVRRLLRRCYRLGAPMCIFLGCVCLFVITGTILLIAVPASRRRTAEAAGAAADPSQRQAEVRLPENTAVPATPIVVEAGGEPGDAGMPGNAAPSPEAATPAPELRFEKGSRGEEVLAIQKQLISLGYLTLDEPTDYFGNATRDAVRFFQRQHGLDQDGIIGNETYALLNSAEARPYVMTEGAEGEDIEIFQDMLYDLGYLERSQITGYYGTDTVEAVKNFQKRNKLSQDGKAGEKTLEMINSEDARVSYTKEKEIAEERRKAEAEAAKKSVEGRIDTLISVAKSQLGKPYVLGARGPDSYDCSGFVYYCLRKADVYCRRLNAKGYSQSSSWTKISSMSDIKKGDLLFFSSDEDSSVNHVGIYIGSGEMIDASSGNGKVVRRSCRSPYWKRNFVCARRPIE